MASFAYIGDQEETQVFGLVFPHGVPVEVSDERAVRKLSSNLDFSSFVDGVELVQAVERPRRGRPPKAK